MNNNMTMNKYFCFGFFMTIFSITSCHKDKDILASENDHLIFGRFYGLCQGESCIETFQIKNNTLYEDTKDQYRSFKDFNFVVLSNEKYDLVKNIGDFFPSDLWNETDEKVFGCPDCYDQGGYIIQQRRDSVTKSWTLDSNPKDVPEYLHNFMSQINAKIILINQ